MADDSLIAEMYSIVLQGVLDGGQRKINKIYETFDSEKEFNHQLEVIDEVHTTLTFIKKECNDSLRGPIARAPHFLMLFAAVAHALFGIPNGEMNEAMPVTSAAALSDIALAEENLLILDSVLEADESEELDPSMLTFWRASRASTHRIASRKQRFPMFYRALLPELL